MTLLVSSHRVSTECVHPLTIFLSRAGDLAADGLPALQDFRQWLVAHRCQSVDRQNVVLEHVACN